MSALSKWACLPLLLASYISLASAARMLFPLDTDDHSFISASSSPSHDLNWLTFTGLKRKLSVTPSQHDTDDDQSSVSKRMDNAAFSYSSPDAKWLFEEGEGVMSDEDVGTKNVVDGEFDDEGGSFRHSSDKEIDELMDNLEDVGMDNTDDGFDDDKCGTEDCGWSQSNVGSNYGWGWDQGGGSSYGGKSGDSSSYGGGGGGGGTGGGGGGGGGGIPGGIGWDWGIGNIRGGGNIGGGGGNSSRGGISIGGSGGSGRNSWHWGWHWGGGGSKVAASNDPNPNTGASGLTTDTAPAPMSN